MDETGIHAGPAAVVGRLERATNEHDLEALVACFASDYRNETPAHPERGFTGRDQVRANWLQIFAAIPDLTCQVLACAVEGTTAWSEWEHRGTRSDGTPHLMRGVINTGSPTGSPLGLGFTSSPSRRPPAPSIRRSGSRSGLAAAHDPRRRGHRQTRHSSRQASGWRRASGPRHDPYSSAPRAVRRRSGSGDQR